MSKVNEVTALLQGAGVVPKPDEKNAPLDPEDQNGDEGGGQVEAPAGEDPPAEGDAPGDQDGAADLLLADLIEKSGRTAAEIYEKLQVPVGEGKTMPLGELKDLALHARHNDEEVEALRGETADKNRELMIQRLELTNTVSFLHDCLTPDLRAAAERNNALHFERESKLLAAAIPAWSNQTTARAEVDKVIALASHYGLSKPESEALLVDHRLVKLLRDTVMGELKMPGAPKRPLPKPAARRSQISTDAIRRAKAPGASKQDKIAGVSALLSIRN